MSDSERIVDLSEALVWQQLRARGAKMFMMPVFMAVVFAGVSVVSILSPGTITATTQNSLQQIVQQYFGDLESPYTLAIALFLIQGPYLLATFSGVLGVNAGQRLSSELISSGQFELLLTSPYHARQVFVALLLGTTLLTLLHTAVFGAIAIGVPLVMLLSVGAELGVQVNGILYLAFILPLPTAIWANLVVILGSMGFFGDLLEGAEDVFGILGIAPGICLLLLINFFPQFNLVVMAVVSVLLVLALIGACTYWVTAGFNSEEVLPS
jgi:ethanolamine transporter